MSAVSETAFTSNLKECLLNRLFYFCCLANILFQSYKLYFQTKKFLDGKLCNIIKQLINMCPDSFLIYF